METRSRENRFRAPGYTSPEECRQLTPRVESSTRRARGPHLMCFHLRLDGRLEEGLHQFLQVGSHRLGIAAAEGEAAPLHGRHVWVYRLELGGALARLAQFGPGVDQLAVVLDAFQHHGEALAVGRH